MDNPYSEIQKIVGNLEIDKLDEHLEECRELLRKEYRKTWSIESI